MTKSSIIQTMAAALFLAAVALTGCSGGSSATISMTTEGRSGEVQFRMGGEGAALIDWGDGSAPRKVTLNSSGGRTYEHTYTDRPPYRISIDGDSITWLACGEDRSLITSLDVSNNPALTSLNCYGTKGLDVSNNTALTYLHCGYSGLTAEELNTLFGTLHANTGKKVINIEDNPGAADCDRSIATKKGWTVED